VPLESDERPYHHRFSIGVIKLVLDLYRNASLEYRTISRVLEVVFSKCCMRIPHHTTVRFWVIRNGCYILQKPIEKAEDWVAIGDLTIDIGKIKCLAILGVRMNTLELRGDYTLSHEDVQLLGLYPTVKSTGEFIGASFIEMRMRIGNDLLALLIDQGSDIKKGARMLQNQDSNTKIIHDIPHKLSLVMEYELKEDTQWNYFTKKLLETRRFVLQTELAAIKPGNQRTKARFMDIRYLVEWPRKILEIKQKGFLDSISEERYQKYFGWIKEFDSSLNDWEFMVGAVDLIKSVLRQYGLSRETFEYIKMFFEESVSTYDCGERLRLFTETSLRVVEEECNKLIEGQTLICSTEVIESVFGKFKAIINDGHQGITSNVLGLATFVGPIQTAQEVKRAMEKSSTRSTMGWVKEKVGTTIGSLRYQYFKGVKETKFDSLKKPAFCI